MPHSLWYMSLRHINYMWSSLISFTVHAVNNGPLSCMGLQRIQFDFSITLFTSNKNLWLLSALCLHVTTIRTWVLSVSSVWQSHTMNVQLACAYYTYSHALTYWHATQYHLGCHGHVCQPLCQQPRDVFVWYFALNCCINRAPWLGMLPPSPKWVGRTYQWPATCIPHWGL